MNNKTLIICFTLMIFWTPSHAEYFYDFHDHGINFVHDNGNSKQFYYPEIVGSGVALFDFDNDGDLDIYLVQSGSKKENKKSDKLYLNSLNESKPFENFDLKINTLNYGIGIATSDVNNDGWTDIYVTNFEQNQMLINQKGQGFKQQSIAEEVHLWSSSASFCDINNDGYEDLYVSNYVNWSIENNPKCYNPSSKQDYCGPGSFEGLKDTFYLNINGQMHEKTEAYFKKMPAKAGLNVVCSDVNNDGYSDFIVANDGQENLLWLNHKGKYFTESGLLSGLAVNSQGVAEASMGMAMSDYDLDGDTDIFFTHLMNETNTLYQNNGKGYFRDVTSQSRLSTDGFAYTGWATYFLMVNNDIYPDLMVFNGAVADNTGNSALELNLKEANQLYINSADSKFKAVISEKWLQKKYISRGAAFGDLDNDGDVDIVVNNNNESPSILINNLNPAKWLGFDFDGVKKPDYLFLKSAKHNQKIRIQTDGGYASAQDNRVVLNQAQLAHFSHVSFYKNKKELSNIKLSDLSSDLTNLDKILTFNQYNKIIIK